jgi:hypothetical protein
MVKASVPIPKRSVDLRATSANSIGRRASEVLDIKRPNREANQSCLSRYDRQIRRKARGMRASRGRAQSLSLELAFIGAISTPCLRGANSGVSFFNFMSLGQKNPRPDRTNALGHRHWRGLIIGVQDEIRAVAEFKGARDQRGVGGFLVVARWIKSRGGR